MAALPLSAELLLIPNTIGIVRGGPNPREADILFEYLQRREVIERLVAASALEGLSVAEVSTVTMKADWQKLLDDLESTTAKLNEIFLR